MTDILNRVELHNPDQARAVLKSHTLPWVGQQLEKWRLHILDTWEKAGHSRAELAQLAKPAGVPLEPEKRGR